MNWLKRAKREKEKRIWLEEKTAKWQEYLKKSGIQRKIWEVKSEIEKETDLKFSAGNFSSDWYRTQLYVSYKPPYGSAFCVEAKYNGIHFWYSHWHDYGGDRTKRIDPYKISKRDIYRWFRKIVRNS